MVCSEMLLTASANTYGLALIPARSTQNSQLHLIRLYSRERLRIMRTLFSVQESYTTGKDADPAKEGDNKQTANADNITAQPPKPRNERDMLDATFKELFVCVRVYDNGSGGSMPVVYSLPTQRVALSTLDFLVSFGKVGKRRKKVIGSWTSLQRYVSGGSKTFGCMLGRGLLSGFLRLLCSSTPRPNCSFLLFRLIHVCLL
jgi:hypothetical protein